MTNSDISAPSAIEADGRSHTYVMADNLAGVIKVGRAVNVDKRLREHNFSTRQHSRSAIERIIGTPVLLSVFARFQPGVLPEWRLIDHFKRTHIKISPQHYEWFYWRGSDCLEDGLGALVGGVARHG